MRMNGTTISDWFIDSMSSNTTNSARRNDVIPNLPKKRISRIKIGKTCYIIFDYNIIIWFEPRMLLHIRGMYSWHLFGFTLRRNRMHRNQIMQIWASPVTGDLITNFFTFYHIFMKLFMPSTVLEKQLLQWFCPLHNLWL